MGVAPPGDPLCVLQGVLDADVPVQGDEAQVEDGGGGAHHVGAEIKPFNGSNTLYIVQLSFSEPSI